MSETTASEAPEEVEKVKPAHSEKGVCKHWAQKGFCFYGADNECKFLHPVKEAPRVAAIRELENKGEDQTELLKAVKDVMTSADRRLPPHQEQGPRGYRGHRHRRAHESQQEEAHGEEAQGLARHLLPGQG